MITLNYISLLLIGIWVGVKLYNKWYEKTNKDKILHKKVKEGFEALYELQKDSGMLAHLDSEYNYVFKDYKDDEMQSLMHKCLKEVIAVISYQSHSGFSIGYFRNQLIRLLEYKPLGKLTFNDEDFNPPYCGDGTQQHKRDSKYFKDGDKISYLDASYFKESWYIGEDLKLIKDKYTHTFQGGGDRLLLTNEGLLVSARIKGIIKDLNNLKEEPFEISVISIEIPKDWWLTIILESDLEEYSKYYEVEYISAFGYSSKEVYQFNDGLYQEDIEKAINIIQDTYGFDSFNFDRPLEEIKEGLDYSYKRFIERLNKNN